MINILKNKMILSSLVLVFFYVSCTDSPQQEGIKSETAKAETQEVQDLIARLETTSDSLKLSYNKLKDQNKIIEKKLDQLKTQESALKNKEKEINKRQKQQRIEDLQAVRDSLKSEYTGFKEQKALLEKSYKSIQDSLNHINQQLNSLAEQKNDLLNQEQFTDTLKAEAGQHVKSGVSEIDYKLNALQNEKSSEKRKLNLTHKKIEIAQKKLNAFKEEKDLYEVQKNELMRDNKSQKTISKIEQEITNIENQIKLEEIKLNKFQTAVTTSESWIAKIDTRINKLRNSINNEYDKKKLFENFFDSEIGHLQDEQNRIVNEKEQLTAQLNDWKKERNTLKKHINNLDTTVRTIKNKEIAKLDSTINVLQKSESDIAGEEAKLHEDNIHTEAFLEQQHKSNLDTVLNEASGKLSKLAAEIARQKKEIAQQKAELAKNRQNALIGKYKNSNSEKVESRSALAISLGSVLIIGIIAVSVLFFIGKSFKKKKVA